MLLVFLVLSTFACKKDALVEPLAEQTASQPVTIEEVVSATASAETKTLNGNGTTDNRTALQKLVNDYAAKNKTLVLPKGKFLISDEVVLPTNTSIEGQGDATEIILTGGSAANRRVFKVPSKVSNIKLKSLKINANQSKNTGAQLVAFYVSENVKTVYSEKVTFAGGRDGGAVQVKGLNSAQVSPLSFISCKFAEAGRTSLELRGTKDVVITNCVFENWGSQNPNSPAIQLQSQDNVNVKITKNTFNNKFGVQFAIECANAYVVNSVISDNKLNDPNNLGGNGISGYYKNTSITNNIMQGGKGHQRSGLEIFGSYNTLSYNTITAGNIAISGGKAEDGTGIVISFNNVKTKNDNVCGIMLGGGGYNLNNVKIANNTVDTRLSKGNSSAIILGTYGATRAVSDINVVSNTLYTNAHCIRLQALAGSKNITIERNAFKAGSTWLGYITNTFSNIVIKGNVNSLSNKTVSYSVSSTPKVVVQ